MVQAALIAALQLFRRLEVATAVFLSRLLVLLLPVSPQAAELMFPPRASRRYLAVCSKTPFFPNLFPTVLLKLLILANFLLKVLTWLRRYFRTSTASSRQSLLTVVVSEQVVVFRPSIVLLPFCFLFFLPLCFLLCLFLFFFHFFPFFPPLFLFYSLYFFFSYFFLAYLYYFFYYF